MSRSQKHLIALAHFFLMALILFLLPACSGAELESTPVPKTREIDMDTLLPLAVELCDAVRQDMPVNGSPPEGPIFSVVQKIVKADDTNEPEEWNYFEVGSTADIALDASELKTVVCIKEKKFKTSITYMGGGVGIRLDWDIYLIDGETGELLAPVETFKGTDPPDYSRSGSKETFGTEPEQDRVRRWILDQISS